MSTLLLLTIAACIISLGLTPLTRCCSAWLGLVDRPDQKRKIHSVVVPRTGGIPVLLSYLGALAIVAADRSSADRLIGPIILIFVTGLLDDWLNLRPWQKLIGQVGAAVWAFSAGVRMEHLGGHALPGWCAFGVTAGWLVLCSNAINLIDGVDGLAAGVGFTATVTALIAAVLRGDYALAAATAPLAGALLGFLWYNFNPASIFLGDSGSLLIGFLLGAYGILWGQTSRTIAGLAAPAMALALPLLEVGLSVLRRFLANAPIFEGDRGHIHHRLLDRGFSPRTVALVLYGGCAVGASLSLLECGLHRRYAGVVVALFGLLAWSAVRFLGYVEFGAATRFLTTRLRPTMSGHVKLELMARQLESAATIEECWDAIEFGGQSLGYSRINARLAGVRFQSAAAASRGDSWWQMRLNLPGNDYVNVTRNDSATRRGILLISFVEVLGQALPAKLAAIENQAAAGLPLNSSTTTVMSSDWGAPSVNAATPS